VADEPIGSGGSPALRTAKRLRDLMLEHDPAFSRLEPRSDEADSYWETNFAPVASELIHPDVEIRSHFIQAEAGHGYRGMAGLRRWTEDLLDVFSEFQRHSAAFEEVSDGVILVQQEGHAVGRSSGIPIDLSAWLVWRFEEGRLRLSDTFLNEKEARAAARAETPV
jgi:hypothetical protein